jgi:ABC-type amino acid transport substrate-binding protein
MNKIALPLLIIALFMPSALPAQEKNNTVYDRVISTGVLRCGYTPWPGLIDVEPNTGKLSGTFHDYLNELARTMEIKVEWIAEVPFGEIPEALNSGKIDAHCSGAWTNPVRGKFADSIVPVSYQYVAAFARNGDKRFDNSTAIINKKDIKISVIDGESSSAIAATLFPYAAVISNPQGTDGTQMLLDVITGKADVAFTDQAMLEKVMNQNPDKIRQVPLAYPLQVFGNPIWIKKGEAALKNTLDLATMQLINDGTIERILTRHESATGMFLRPNTSYLK